MKKLFQGQKLISITLATWGLVMIITGMILNTQKRTVLKADYTVDISSTRVTSLKTVEIKLKKMELDINNPLSVDVKDYIENIAALDPTIVNSLKLDTSMVNINEAGIYTYIVTFKNKKYNGQFVIKDKPLPNFALTLKDVNLEVGAAISTNVTSYIKENLPEQVRNNLILDLSEVSTSNPGTYIYKITYNKKIYTGKVIVTAKQDGPMVIKPKDSSNNQE